MATRFFVKMQKRTLEALVKFKVHLIRHRRQSNLSSNPTEMSTETPNSLNINKVNPLSSPFPQFKIFRGNLQLPLTFYATTIDGERSTL